MLYVLWAIWTERRHLFSNWSSIHIGRITSLVKYIEKKYCKYDFDDKEKILTIVVIRGRKQ